VTFIWEDANGTSERRCIIVRASAHSRLSRLVTWVGERRNCSGAEANCLGCGGYPDLTFAVWSHAQMMIWLHHASEPSSSQIDDFAIVLMRRGRGLKPSSSSIAPCRALPSYTFHPRLGCAPIWSAALYVQRLQVLFFDSGKSADVEH
jgi:hypothetical protein